MFSLPEFIKHSEKAVEVSKKTGRPVNDVLHDMEKEEQKEHDVEEGGVMPILNNLLQQMNVNVPFL